MSLKTESISSRADGECMVRVLEAKRQGVFLHLQCHKCADFEAIEQLMERLAMRIEQSPAPATEFDIENRYVAVRVDGRWMRGKGLSGGFVNLFDICERRHVEMEDVRFAVPEMPASLVTFRCILANFYAHPGPTMIEDAIKSMMFKMERISPKVMGCRFATLRMTEITPAEVWLQDKNLGVTADTHEHQDFFHQDAVDEAALVTARQSHPDAAPPLDMAALGALRMLPMLVRMAVKVVSAPQGPSSFYVQLSQHDSFAQLMAQVLQAAAPLRSMPLVGQGVVAPGPDGNLTRALVISTNQLLVEVKLIDLDMSTTFVEATRLRQLHSELYKIPPLVTSVQLKGSSRFAQSSASAFLSLTLGREFEMSVIEREDLKMLCRMTSSDGDVLSLTSDKVARKAYRQQLIQPGERFQVLISSVRPKSFFVQLIVNKPQLNALQEKVNYYCKMSNAPGNLRLLCGDTVFAKCHESGEWCRAVIIEHQIDSPLVFFVDTGMQSPTDEIRIADPELVLNLEAQAVECVFSNFEMDSESSAALKTFKKAMMMEVVERLPEDRYSVTMLDLTVYPCIDVALMLQQRSLTRSNSMCSISMTASNGSSDLPNAFDLYKVQEANITSTRALSADSRCSIASAGRNDQLNTTPIPTVTPIQPAFLSSPNNSEPSFATPSPLKGNESTGSGGLYVPPGRRKLENEASVCEASAKRNKVEPDLPQPPPSATSVQPTEDYANVIVLPGSRFTASLSWMENPCKFYIQPVCMLESLDKLMEKIELSDPSTKLAEPAAVFVGMPCLAKYEGAWYRAKIVSVAGKEIEVLYVDYGNKSKLSIDELRQIPSLVIFESSALAIPCSLRGIDTSRNWRDSETTALNAKLESTKFAATVGGIWNDTFSVVIQVKSENINMMFGAREESLPPLTSIASSELPVSGTAKVTWLSNPNSFYLQPSCNFEKFVELRNNCNDCFKGNSVKADSVKENMHFLAKCMDNGSYYRALVKDTKEDKAKVFLIDVGRIMICNKADLLTLPDQLHVMEPLVHHCSLDGVEPLPGMQWPKPGSNPDLESLFSSTNLEFKCIGTGAGGEPARVELREGGRNLCDILVEKGLAKRVRGQIPSPQSVPTDLSLLKHFNTLGLHNFPEIVVRDAEAQKDLTFIKVQISQEMKSVHKVTPGELYALLFDLHSEERAWYRAQAIAVDKFYLLDHGIETSSHVGLKELPPSIKNLEPLAVRARLPLGPPSGQNQLEEGKVIQKFEELVKLDDMACQVIGLSGGVLYLDPLTAEKKRVADILEKQGLASSTLHQVFICLFTNASDLHVHDDERKVAWMEQQLESPMQPLPEHKAGQICAAEFDGCKYRARVLDDLQSVLFIDYGNVETAASTLWQLDPELEAIPPLAKKCFLKGGEDLTPDEENALTELLDFNVQYLAVYEEGDVVLLFKNGRDLIELAKETATTKQIALSEEAEVEKEEIALDEKGDSETNVTEVVEIEADQSVGDLEVVEEAVAPNEPEIAAPEETAITASTETEVIQIESKQTDMKTEYKEGNLQPYYISSFISNQQFYLQSDPDAVVELSKLLAQGKDCPTSEIGNYDLCAALPESPDASWGRVHIHSLRPPSGFFFDIGLLAPICKLKILEPQLAEADPLAMRCYLEGELPAGKQLGQGSWIVADEVEPDGRVHLPPADCWRNAIVTHYESHCELYLRLSGDNIKLMESRLELGGGVTEAKVNQIYAAPNGQGGWSRARVTNIGVSGCDVFFVDHGHYGRAQRLKTLAPHWASRPEAARLCFLQPAPPLELGARLRQLLRPGLLVQVSGLGGCLRDAAQGVALRVQGQPLELAAVNEINLRPDADVFVPTTDWDAVTRCFLSKYFNMESDATKETWDQAADGLMRLLRAASLADGLTPEGKLLFHAIVKRL